MEKIRVAAGQAPTACLDESVGQQAWERNAQVAAELAVQAADSGARVLVLPEAFLTTYCPLAFAAAPTEFEVGHLLEPVQAVAEARGIDVLVSTPVARGGGATLSLAWVRPSGEVRVAYDKQHLSGDLEKTHFVPGEVTAPIELDGWKVGLSVCYDGSFPEHARAAADAGARLYVNSAAFFVGGEHRRDLYLAARALDNGVYSLFAGATGECVHLGAPPFAGGSAVHDPEGRTLGRLGRERGVVVADLDPDVLAATRAAHTMHADRRN